MDARLTAKQSRAIEALIAGETVITAATAAGVNRRQVQRWMSQNVAFAAALRTAQTEVFAGVVRRLSVMADSALDTLEAAMAGEGKALSVRAADIVLTKLLVWKELVDLEARVAALEQQR